MSTAAHPLTAYGWDEGFADSHAPFAVRGLVPGRIVRVDRGHCDVVVASADGTGVRTVRADAAPVATGDPIGIMCTGDWAAVDLTAGHVRALLPRRTAFVRSTSSKRSDGQILAANVDRAVIAFALTADPDLGRVERFLALAWESGAEPVVALTKADLVPDAGTLAHLLADTRAVAPGARVLAVSSATGEGVGELAALLAGGTGVLLGQSGAGKSTLANALVGEDVQDVRAIRDRDGKGRHTTTTRNLLPLPLPGGGVLIDTPGLRGVGLWDASSGVARTFSDVESLAAACRFHDCGHDGEPGCAVAAAVASGELGHRRLDSYRKLLRENARIAARTDARLRAEMRREWKRRQAEGERAADLKRGRSRR